MSIFDSPLVEVKFIQDFEDSWNMKYRKGQVISVRRCPSGYVAVLGQGDFQDIPDSVIIEIR